MSSCSEITRLLSQALERKLSPEEGVQVRGHLRSCANCKQYQQQLAAMRNMARRFADPEDQQASVAFRLSGHARRRMEASLEVESGDTLAVPPRTRAAPRVSSAPAADDEAPEATIQVYVFKQGEFLGSELIDSTRLELGRDLACDVVLEDELVSRRHAAVTLFRGHLYLEDLSSSNGTFVNSAEVKGRQQLRHRDEVGIGDHTVKLKVLRGGAEPPAPAEHVPDATEVRPIPDLGGAPSVLAPQPTPSSELPTDAFALPAQPEVPDATDVEGPDLEAFSSPVPADIFNAPTEYQSSDDLGVEGPLDPSLAALLDSDADLHADLLSPVATFPEASGGPPLGVGTEATDAGISVGDGLMEEATNREPAPLAPPGRGAFDALQGNAHLFDTEDEAVDPAIAAYEPPPPSAPSLRPAPPVDGEGDFTERINTSHQEALQRRRRARTVGSYQPGDDQLDPSLPASGVWEDDEDYDPDDEPAPYSLVENLLRERFRGQDVEQVGRPVLEIIRYQGDVVKELAALEPGRGFIIGERLMRGAAAEIGVPANHKLARLSRRGEALLHVRRGFSGKVHQGGRSLELDQACEWRGEQALLRLQAGDLANLHIGPDAYFVRFAFPPALKGAVTRRGRATPEQRVDRRRTIASFVSSGSAHLSALMLLYILSLISPPQLVTQLDEDRFVQMEMKELELETPPEEEPEEAPEETTEEVPEESPKPKPKKRHLSNANTPAPKKPGILAALGKIPKKSGAAGSQTLTAAVSNLDAVKVPGGGATYKVSGLIGKGPSNRVRIGGSGGGVATKGLASILREGGGGPGTLSKLKSSKVRGRLVKASRGSKMKGTGYLDRAEIQKVVNKGLGQIQFCYEKELLKNQSLSGKVIFEWTISQTGKVSIVKTTTSTLKSSSAVTCMIGAIKKWKFPKPRGGTVIVTYPFIFNAMGF